MKKHKIVPGLYFLISVPNAAVENVAQNTRVLQAGKLFEFPAAVRDHHTQNGADVLLKVRAAA